MEKISKIPILGVGGDAVLIDLAAKRRSFGATIRGQGRKVHRKGIFGLTDWGSCG